MNIFYVFENIKLETSFQKYLGSSAGLVCENCDLIDAYKFESAKKAFDLKKSCKEHFPLGKYRIVKVTKREINLYKMLKNSMKENRELKSRIEKAKIILSNKLW